MSAPARLVELLGLARGGPLLVVTGAGVSLASGIPTFRGSDPGALWRDDVLEKGTLAYFRRDPIGSWRWYLERFERVRGARPNPAHHALAAIERWFGDAFLLVTQNVDTLHQAAGSRRLVQVHGSVERLRCSADGCALGAPSGSLARGEVDVEPFLAAPSLQTLPCCRECGDVLRPHVLWFDETYDGHDSYEFHRVRRFMRDEALTILFVGTSLSVGLTDVILRNADYLGQTVILLDPGQAPRLELVTHLQAPAEVALPEACRLLGIPLEGPSWASEPT